MTNDRAPASIETATAAHVTAWPRYPATSTLPGG